MLQRFVKELESDAALKERRYGPCEEDDVLADLPVYASPSTPPRTPRTPQNSLFSIEEESEEEEEGVHVSIPAKYAVPRCIRVHYGRKTHVFRRDP